MVQHYPSANNAAQIRFIVFRIGNRNVEAVGIGAPANNPTGPWQYVCGVRNHIVDPP